jgi:hypothetical protein
VIGELEGTPRIEAEAAIAKARVAVRTDEPGWCENRSVTRAELHKMIDELPDNAVDGAGVLLRGIINGPLDPDQAWFWTPDWQRKEHEADADKAAGKADRFDSDDDFLAALDKRSDSSDADV